MTSIVFLGISVITFAITYGLALNGNNDGGILPTADAQVKSNGNKKIFF